MTTAINEVNKIKMFKDIEKVIAKQTGFKKYDFIELAFGNLEYKIMNLGTIDEVTDEIIMTPNEEKMEALLIKELKGKIDKTFLKITEMLKKKYDIEIETPTHKDFRFLTETEMGDFIDVIAHYIEQKEVS